MIDALSGRTRTWPYGTKKTVTVDTIKLGLLSNDFDVICIEQMPNGDREGYLLIGCKNLVAVEVGKRYVMEFTKGGPCGGYWRIIAEANE